MSKYKVSVMPEIPNHAVKLLSSLLGKIKKQLRLILLSFVQHQWHLYSKEEVKETMSFGVEHDGVKYALTIDWVSKVTPFSKEHVFYLKFVLSMLMRECNFEKFGRRFFMPDSAAQFPLHQLELWPGFDVKLNLKQDGVFLTIDPCHRLIRYQTSLEKLTMLMDVCDSRGLDFESEV